MPGLPSPPDLDRLGPLERERLPAAIRSGTPRRSPASRRCACSSPAAVAVRPGFAVTAANAADIASIVAHLGGVPLAIELAAARLRFLTPAAIHERLEGRLDLPGAGAADVPERQRSLRGAIMWSHELLDAPACRLFERLSVFMGGFDLARAEAVAGPASDLGIDVLDGLASLVDQSLVRSDEVEGEPRFSMLEPIREYAVERLEAAGNADAFAERHARAYLELARELEPDLAGARQRAALDRLELEHANLRAAIDWADARGDAELALGIDDRRLALLAEARLPARGARASGGADRSPLVRCGARAAAGEDPRGPRRHHLLARPGLRRATRLRDRSRDLARDRAISGRSPTRPTTCPSATRWPCSRRCRRTPASRRTRCSPRPWRSTARWATPSARRTCYWGIGIQHYFAGDNAEAAVAFEAALALYRKVGDGRRRRGRCTSWARRASSSARPMSRASSSPTGCGCSPRPAMWRA